MIIHFHLFLLHYRFTFTFTIFNRQGSILNFVEDDIVIHFLLTQKARFNDLNILEKLKQMIMYFD